MVTLGMTCRVTTAINLLVLKVQQHYFIYLPNTLLQLFKINSIGCFFNSSTCFIILNFATYAAKCVQSNSLVNGNKRQES